MPRIKTQTPEQYHENPKIHAERLAETIANLLAELRTITPTLIESDGATGTQGADNYVEITINGVVHRVKTL